MRCIINVVTQQFRIYLNKMARSMPTELPENIAESSSVEKILEDGFYLIIHRQRGQQPELYRRDLDNTHIQFHFCLKGRLQFTYNEGRYTLDLRNDQSLLLYNTLYDLPIHMEMDGGAVAVSLILTIRKFHALFSSEASYIRFLNPENRDKKYYAQESFPPAINVILSQIIQENLHTSVSNLFLRGKAFELLAHYFNRSEEATLERCPYMEDEDDVKKIRRAKDLVILQLAEPPGLQELAEEVGLPLKKLKSGFKQVYGTSVYGFLWEYKMDYARKLLETEQFSVNEVALRVGYSAASHFIAAFKKRFATTPKKYLMSLSAPAT